MTDEITPPAPPKKDDKKPPTGNGRGPKRTASVSKPAGAPNQGAPRPASRSSANKKTSAPAAESGSESASRKSDSGKKPDQQQRNKSQSGSGRPQQHRKGQASASQGQRSSTPKDQPPKQGTPTPAQTKESSDALSSLQRVIADLRTTSPQPPMASFQPSQPPTSTLPLNAPVFQPGAAAYPGIQNSADAKHRKAASLGNSGLSGNFNSFAPNLGSMMEDVDVNEEGEIHEQYYPQQQQGHQPRSQSQSMSFTAPRFAALAAQQEQESVGPSGRPQLAPNFMFGAKKRGGGMMGPPIDEEDVGFQFPQQQISSAEPSRELNMQHGKTDSGEITGIMAEQVCSSLIWFQDTVLTDLSRLLFRIRLSFSSSNSRRFTSSNWRPTKSSLSKPLALLPTGVRTGAFRVLFPWVPRALGSGTRNLRWANSVTLAP